MMSQLIYIFLGGHLWDSLNAHENRGPGDCESQAARARQIIKEVQAAGSLARR